LLSAIYSQYINTEELKHSQAQQWYFYDESILDRQKGVLSREDLGFALLTPNGVACFWGNNMSSETVSNVGFPSEVISLNFYSKFLHKN
jgi:hypothetical protein